MKIPREYGVKSYRAYSGKPLSPSETDIPPAHSYRSNADNTSHKHKRNLSNGEEIGSRLCVPPALLLGQDGIAGSSLTAPGLTSHKRQISYGSLSHVELDSALQPSASSKGTLDHRHPKPRTTQISKEENPESQLIHRSAESKPEHNSSTVVALMPRDEHMPSFPEYIAAEFATIQPTYSPREREEDELNFATRWTTHNVEKKKLHLHRNSPANELQLQTPSMITTDCPSCGRPFGTCADSQCTCQSFPCDRGDLSSEETTPLQGYHESIFSEQFRKYFCCGL